MSVLSCFLRQEFFSKRLLSLPRHIDGYRQKKMVRGGSVINQTKLPVAYLTLPFSPALQYLNLPYPT